MSKTYNYQVAGTFDVSTTGNIDDLDFQKCGVIRMTNASLATIRGLKAGYPGQEVSIVSIGAGQVDLAHQNTNSAAANRLINFATSISSPLAAGVGAATLKYDETTARWRLVSHFQGAGITYTATYTASSGNWTDVTATTLSYLLENRYLTITFDLSGSKVSATPGTLFFTVPTGASGTSDTRIGCQAVSNTVTSTGGGFVRIASTATALGLFYDWSGTNWSTDVVGNTSARGVIRFQIP